MGWLAFSAVFSFYAANFGTFNQTYGSLGAVIGFMLWMWLSTTVILLGAKLNAEIEHQTVRDTTEAARAARKRRACGRHGRPKPTDRKRLKRAVERAASMAEITAYSSAWRRHRHADILQRIERLRRLAWTSMRSAACRHAFRSGQYDRLGAGRGRRVMALISLYIIAEAARLGLPRRKIVRMLANVGIEAAVGSVPILGDIFDTFWKANLRKSRLSTRIWLDSAPGLEPPQPSRR